eukprot:TRINITY_DN30473_c0_g1_i1.p1 TRINITY_DN30473_c0_g1~~TRINITY_DN30473_c0_g1_i1.p1  ORF type:complete len:150 (-),score=8.01 TRINITY_DN30473_c0_g1_i1:91-540(-)
MMVGMAKLALTCAFFAMPVPSSTDFVTVWSSSEIRVNGERYEACSGWWCDHPSHLELTCDSRGCIQAGSYEPRCSEGGCNQAGSNAPRCSGGGCNQVGSNAPECSGGGCNSSWAFPSVTSLIITRSKYELCCMVVVLLCICINGFGLAT